jgi:hypothetical protein
MTKQKKQIAEDLGQKQLTPKLKESEILTEKIADESKEL